MNLAARDRAGRVHAEAESLWLALFGESPPEGLDGEILLQIAVARVASPDYDRFHSPHLRPSQLTRPR
ncbi:MAG: hypothetical protein ACK41C_14595 [Phenylobacterium sp.]|jgi:hypothetical protein|uniref:hypothetical protein n=1 Tax=Phenylobacterium sp. TaxID=1871053 RepID=UPI00391AC6D9